MNVIRLALTLVVAGTICGTRPAQGQVKFVGKVRYEPQAIQLFGCGFSPDGTYLVTGGDLVRVFHASTGELLQQLRPNLQPRDTDAGLISIRHWVNLVRRNQWTRKIVFSPVIKDLFATAGDDGVVRIWQVSCAQPVHVLEGHKGRVTTLAFSPNGRLVASGGSRSKRQNSIDEFKLWDVATGKLLQSDNFYNDGVNCISFLDDDTVAFSKNDDKSNRESVIEFFDVASWSLVRSVPFTPGKAFSIAFTPTRNKMIITGGECVPLGPNNCRPTGYLWLADLRNQGHVQRVKTKPHGYFNRAILAAPGDRFVTSTSLVFGPRVADHLEMRSTMDGKILWSRDCGTASMLGLAVSPAGTQIAYCGQQQIVFLDAETGQQTRSIQMTH